MKQLSKRNLITILLKLMMYHDKKAIYDLVDSLWVEPYVKGVKENGDGTITIVYNDNRTIIINNLTDEKVKYDADDPTAGYLAEKIVPGTGISITEGTGADENKIKISIIPDTDIKVAIDFVDADNLEFVYNCPVALKFTSQESEGADAAISPALNTDMAQYGKVTITAAEVGLIVLNGVTL